LNIDAMSLFRFAIPARICGKRRPLIPTILSILILFFLCPLAVHAVFAAGHKTDAELTEAMVGTWEGLPTEIGVSKAFILLNADGTFRAFELTNNHGSAVRLETEGRWRINNRWVLWEITKEIPPNEKTHYSSHLRDYIELIGGGRVKLADGRKTANAQD
jgi:hypothetical protein